MSLFYGYSIIVPHSVRNSHLMLSRNIFDRMLSLAQAYNSENNLIDLNSSSLISTITRCFYLALAASQKEPKRIGMRALRATTTMLSRVIIVFGVIYSTHIERRS